jgi:broad specificity phosphatase PhoE
MSTPLLYLVRHGQTAWSVSGQHTGLTDIPLTDTGEVDGRAMAGRLRGIDFARVLSSPLQRAKRTCDLAGYETTAEVDRDLVEWDYGRIEGKTSKEIKAATPGWDLFRDGGPGGESAAAIAARADRVVARVRETAGNVLLFSSGHFLRVLAARWCGLDITFARHLLLSTASVSILGYDHNDLREPAIKVWNQSA